MRSLVAFSWRCTPSGLALGLLIAPSNAAPTGAASANTSSAASAKPQPAKAPLKPAAAKGPVSSGAGKPKLTALAAAWAPPGYVAMVKKWHEPTKPTSEKGRPKLVLRAINGTERVELEPLTEHGGFAPTELDKASHILRSSDGGHHPVDPRILDLAYALQRRFGAGEIRFLSGYRTPRRGASNHGFGRAIDLVVPGATDEEVAIYARTLGFVGVGIYPTSGFVHLDVRDRSFFWADRSGPGKPNKTVSILGGEAAANDAIARKAGEVGAPSTKIGRDVDAALLLRAKAVSAAAPAPPPVVEGDEPSDDHDH